MTRALLAALALLLSGCWATAVDGDDLSTIPAGPPVALGADARGPVIVVGSGRSEGIGWRYSVYESARGTCSQLELGNLGTAGCGDLLPVGNAAFGSIGTTEASASYRYAEGIVSSDVPQLFVEMENGERLRVGLMPLAPAGYEAQAFVVFIPAGDTPDHLAAEDGDGVQLGTFEISNLGP